MEVWQALPGSLLTVGLDGSLQRAVQAIKHGVSAVLWESMKMKGHRLLQVVGHLEGDAIAHCCLEGCHWLAIDHNHLRAMPQEATLTNSVPPAGPAPTAAGTIVLLGIGCRTSISTSHCSPAG